MALEASGWVLFCYWKYSSGCWTKLIRESGEKKVGFGNRSIFFLYHSVSVGVSSTSLLPQDVKWMLQLQASHKHSGHQKEERQVTAKSVQFISIYHEIKSFPRSSHLSRFLHWSKWGHIANSSFKEGWELSIWQGTIGLTWLAEAHIHYHLELNTTVSLIKLRSS